MRRSIRATCDDGAADNGAGCGDAPPLDGNNRGVGDDDERGAARPRDERGGSGDEGGGGGGGGDPARPDAASPDDEFDAAKREVVKLHAPCDGYISG